RIGEQLAHVAELVDGGAGGLLGARALRLEFRGARDEVGADLLLEVERVGRRGQLGEELVEQAVDGASAGAGGLGVHEWCLSDACASRRESMMSRVAVHAATLRRYTFRPASVMR